MNKNLDSEHSDEQKIAYLGNFALELRKDVLRMIAHGKASHIGSNLSMIEILSVLYGWFLRLDPDCPEWEDRDRFILSKGHACAAVYAALAEVGFFPRNWLLTFCCNGGRLAGHATHKGVPGIEISTGSLGHGLSVACGMALAAKRDKKSYRVVALLSDGECDEGSVWEAILFASHHRLDNLLAIVDYNKIQSLGTVEEVLDLDPFVEKWNTFGWVTKEVDGHDIVAILKALRKVPFEGGSPSCLIAHTVKGAGVSFMEDKLLWHYRCPSEEEVNIAIDEISRRK